MEILPKTNLDFDGLADSVAGRFFEDGTELNQGVIDVAEKLDLNPEEVRRLVEKTNTIATVKMLRSTRDKKSELNLADFDEVKKSTHPDGVDEDEDVADEEKTASERRVFDSLPDTRNTDRYNDIFANYFDKYIVTSEKTASSEKPRNYLTEIFNYEKSIQELSRKKTASELKIQDDLDFIISEFSRWNSPDFNKFANEAVTLHGNIATAPLTKIAEYLGEDNEFEEVSYVVDDGDRILEKIGSVIEGLTSIIEDNKQIEAAKKSLDDTWELAKGR